ncbi:MAG: serine/threonine-protein kinase [Candidatus Acidiferrales bacterium]
MRERELRTRLLIEMELAKKNDFFFGIPFGWLGRLNINGVEIIAHFTRMIRGPYDGGPEDFGRVRSSGRWAPFDKDARLRFAAELAVAVAGLERAGIVHGDISPGNILIGNSSSNGAICILCDYDGYHNAQVPRLPRKDGAFPCRPLGSPGYQYPDLISTLKADMRNDADIWVQTDRFALGVAICEVVVWSDEVEKLLQNEGRGQLLADDVIENRDLSRLPTRIIDRFPDGFLLLDKAIRANSPDSMPSPEDWLRVLGFDDEPWNYRGRPVITLFNGRGNSRAKRGAYRIVRETGQIPQVSGTKVSMR